MPVDKTLRLIDRADGVAGHFCIAKALRGYHQFWHEERGWCSAGTVYNDRETATRVMEVLTGKTAPAWLGRLEGAADTISMSNYAAHEIARYVKRMLARLAAISPDHEQKAADGAMLAAIAIVENWNDWDGAAQQAAQVAQDSEAWWQQMVEHVAGTIRLDSDAP